MTTPEAMSHLLHALGEALHHEYCGAVCDPESINHRPDHEWFVDASRIGLRITQPTPADIARGRRWQLSVTLDRSGPPDSTPDPEDVTAAYATEAIRLLGARLTAYITGAGSTERVHSWSAGLEQPPRLANLRMRVAVHAARIITEAGDSPALIQAWFMGINPDLDGGSVARLLLASNNPEAIASRIYGAARTYAVDRQ